MFVSFIQPLIAQHGYWVVFLIVMLESAGVPLPGETALILAAVYAGATGDLNIVYIILAAASGAIIGDNLGFWAGRRYGVKLLERYGSLIHLHEGRIKLGQYLFERHGAKIVFFGRFIAVLRIFAALLAGVNKYGWGPFLFYNAAGGIAWATIFGYGGYIFGDSVTRVSGPIGIAALVLVVAGLVSFWFVMRHQEQKFEAIAEREIPGSVEEEIEAGLRGAASKKRVGTDV
jgi:membrane protein DedA with SNARE-associated domain